LPKRGSSQRTVSLGDGSDKLVPADYDGDGRTGPAIFREDAKNPERATFLILASGNGVARAEQFGRPAPNDLLRLSGRQACHRSLYPTLDLQS